MAPKVLLVEDEEQIAKAVSAYLQSNGFDVLLAGDGRSALIATESEKPDVVLLDIMLPEIDGMNVLRIIRREYSTPIIMLTARSEESDRVAGLEVGADDYITKPFSLRELTARIRAVLRRVTGGLNPPVLVRGLKIDFDRRQISLRGEALNLTSTEFELLSYLAQFPGRVFTRIELLEAIRGNASYCFDRTIDAHIKNLRKKIEVDSDNPSFIITVQGVGYKFCTE